MSKDGEYKFHEKYDNKDIRFGGFSSVSRDTIRKEKKDEKRKNYHYRLII